MHRELNKLKMRCNEDPSVFFDGMCKIENQFGKSMKEEERMALIMAKVPGDYVSTITAE